jgi:DNA-directed RNA polymerase subunit H (RpoH/RPB5)
MTDRSFLEIVEQEDGEFALKRLDSDDEPLVRIQFSDEVQDFIGSDLADIVKVMIGAGVQKASSMSREDKDSALEREPAQTVH